MADVEASPSSDDADVQVVENASSPPPLIVRTCRLEGRTSLTRRPRMTLSNPTAKQEPARAPIIPRTWQKGPWPIRRSLSTIALPPINMQSVNGFAVVTLCVAIILFGDYLWDEAHKPFCDTQRRRGADAR